MNVNESSGVGLTENFYKRLNPVVKHGSMPPFYMYTQEKEVIIDKSIEV